MLDQVQEQKPRYIILYDADVTFVRQVEVYQAHHPKLQTRWGFIIISDKQAPNMIN